MHQHHVHVSVALLAALAFPSRAHAVQSPTRGTRVVTVTARDFAFEMPTSLPAGPTTFRLLGGGKLQHHLTIVRLDSGKTASDALAALIKAGQGVRPAWIHGVGGPNAIDAKGDSRTSVVLTPGNYFAFCEVPGPDPMPHFAKGMVKAFTVTAPAHAAALPVADIKLSLIDYDFVLSRPITRGKHVVLVTNRSGHPHMMVVRRWAPGTKGDVAKQFLAWAFDPKGALAPGSGAGGVTELASGESATYERNFTPGRYLLLCFVADAKDGKPHFAHGMQKEIVVE